MIPSRRHVTQLTRTFRTRANENLPKLVVFDQNGTLFSLQERWGPWGKFIAQRLSEDLNDPAKESMLLKVLGFRRGRLGPGLLAEGSVAQISSQLITSLVRSGVSVERAERYVQTVVSQAPYSPVAPLASLKHIFSLLHEAGILTAVCTSDVRYVTGSNLDSAGVDPHHVSALMCSDDPTYQPKPSPENIHELCRSLSVEPRDTVVVGDNLCDLHMGRDAQVHKRFGVLTGVATHSLLYPHADTLLTSLHQLLASVMPSQEKDYWHKYMHPMSGMEPDTAAKLVVFDKDGTLLCFDTLWVPWAENTAARLETATGLVLRDELLETYGCDVNTLRCRPGVLAEGSTEMVQDATIRLLVQRGLNHKRAHSVVLEHWQNCDVRSPGNLRVLGDAEYVLGTLQRAGVTVAVCTMDNRAGCESFLDHTGLSRYVDATVCGDDPDIKPKPHRSMGLKACSQLNIQPHHSVIIGDTEADMGLGEAANFKARVAVLSGVGTVQDVGPKATHIVNNINDILPIALPNLYGSLALNHHIDLPNVYGTQRL